MPLLPLASLGALRTLPPKYQTYSTSRFPQTLVRQRHVALSSVRGGKAHTTFTTERWKRPARVGAFKHFLEDDGFRRQNRNGYVN